MDWNKLGSKGAQAREKITEEAENGIERAQRDPFKAALIVVAALVIAFFVGAVLL